MNYGFHTSQTRQPLTLNPSRAVRWPLSGELRGFVRYDLPIQAIPNQP